MQKSIVVLSHPQDTTAQRIACELQARQARMLFLDTGAFPSQAHLSVTFTEQRGPGGICYEDQWYESSKIQSILVRRPTHYQVDQDAPELIQSFLENEAMKGFGGILQSLDDVLWCNELNAHRAANFKPVQLQAASRIGFPVPRSLIPNDPDAVRQFYQETDGNLIYNTLHGGGIAGGGAVTHAIFTSRVTPESLEHLERVRLTAHYFQVEVEKLLELRITVIGTKALAVAIETTGEHVDWRASSPHLRFVPYVLPPDVEDQCCALVRELGVTYAALDVILTNESKYEFLEANAGGQYAFLEEATQIPFSATIADVFIGGKEGLGWEK